ncbi:MAG TPA: hypothetical protein VL401_00045 [Alphaproteobacteria bacterium]|jgi:hypothetical protein|nr:hypothetical protein [Alphaproteobacteria bacterium]
MLAQNLDFNAIQKNAFDDKFKFGSGAKIGDIIGVVVPYVFYAAGIALLVYLVTAGLQMMTSRGDPKAMQMAQAKITNALLGFVIIFVAFYLVQLLGVLLGITQFGEIFK